MNVQAEPGNFAARQTAAPRHVAIANRHPHLKVDRRAVNRVIALLDAHARLFARPAGRPDRGSVLGRPPGVPPGELSVVFLTDHALAQLHADFLADPSATDVITFAGEPAAGLPAGSGPAGEICVSADAAARQVGRRPDGQPRRPADRPTAFAAELTLYLVHGWLHLAGFDDLVPARKREMRRAEARAVTLLRRHDCQPKFVLDRPPRQSDKTRRGRRVVAGNL